MPINYYDAVFTYMLIAKTNGEITCFSYREMLHDRIAFQFQYKDLYILSSFTDHEIRGRNIEEFASTLIDRIMIQFDYGITKNPFKGTTFKKEEDYYAWLAWRSSMIFKAGDRVKINTNIKINGRYYFDKIGRARYNCYEQSFFHIIDFDDGSMQLFKITEFELYKSNIEIRCEEDYYTWLANR